MTKKSAEKVCGKSVARPKSKRGEMEPLKYRKRQKKEKKIPFKTILIDFNISEGHADAVMERFTNSFAFANFGLALQW